MGQYQIPSPKAPILGASAAPVVAVEFLSPAADLASYATVQQGPRYRSAPAPRIHEGASVAPAAQSYLFSVSQPIRRRQIQLPRAKPPIDVVIGPVTQTDVFALSQPDMARFVFVQSARYQVAVVSRPHEGAAAIVPQTYIFSLVQHYDARWYARRPIVGAPERPHEAAAPVTPQTYIFPVSQPEFRAWPKVDANRVPHGSLPQTSGATSQATFIFPVGQPDQARYALVQVARRFGGSVAYPLDTFAPATFAEVIGIVGSYIMMINVVGDKT